MAIDKITSAIIKNKCLSLSKGTAEQVKKLCAPVEIKDLDMKALEKTLDIAAENIRMQLPVKSVQFKINNASSFYSNSSYKGAKASSPPVKKQNGLIEVLRKRLFNVQKKLFDTMTVLLEEKSDAFYQEYKTMGQIRQFEENKNILALFLRQDAKGHGLSNKQYTAFADTLFENLEKPVYPEKLFQDKRCADVYRILKRLNRREINSSFVCEKYYGQQFFARPDISLFGEKTKTDRIKLRPPKQLERADDIMQTLVNSKNLTLENGPILEKYGAGKFYDFPIKFAAASYNTKLQYGRAYIEDKMPDLFKGIKKEELFSALDNVSLLSKFSSIPEGAKIEAEIGNERFIFEALDSGLEAATFRVKALSGADADNKTVIFKNYLANSDKSQSGVSFAPQGFYGGIGILREANFAGVIDVPGLYLANPVFEPVVSAKGFGNQFAKYKGGWAIVEDVSKKTPPELSSGGLNFRSWAKDRGLAFFDDKKDGWVRGFCVDTGFIMPRFEKEFYKTGWGNEGVNYICSQYLNGKSTDEIIEILKQFIK